MSRKLLGLVGIGVVVACGNSQAPKTALSSSESWCPDGFEVGPSDTCFAIPEKHDASTPIVVYLHGMYTGHGSPEEWALVRGVADRGFAIVVPRGKRGLCAWRAELKDHFCWPQETEDPQSFKSVVAGWSEVLWQVDNLLEGGPHKRYVLGFSNGGFFAAELATHGYFDARAYAIVNAGPLEPPPKPPAKAPSLLLVTANDDADQGPKMRELHDGLAKNGWPHAFCSRPGAHALAADDVDAALRFFERDAKGNGGGKGGAVCEGQTKAVAEK